MTQPGGRDFGGNSAVVATPSQAGQTAVVATGGPSGGAGIVATGGTTSGVAIKANGTGTGVAIQATGTAARAPLLLTPGGEPTGPNVVGDLYVNGAGVLCICTEAGSPGVFTVVGEQTA